MKTENTDQINIIFRGVSSLYEIFTAKGLAAGLLIAGLICIFITFIFAIKVVKQDAKDVKTSYQAILFISLVLGCFLTTLSPAVSWIENSRIISNNPIISRAVSFDNLETNKDTQYYIRIIPYNPKENPRLSIRSLNKIGNDKEIYTFAANYAELRGYNVMEAVRMVGGSIHPGDRVSAIIFQNAGLDSYPANARGILQVVSMLQNANPNFSNKLDFSVLSKSEKDQIDPRKKNPSSYRFEAFKDEYRGLCILAHRFMGDNYSASEYVGKLNEDYNTLGFSEDTYISTDYQVKSSVNECDIKSWSQVKSQYLNKFGARIFLVPNLKLDDLAGAFFIDFNNPNEQNIPDIGLKLDEKSNAKP